MSEAQQIRLYNSWREWEGLPDGWNPAPPPGAVEKWPVHNTQVRLLLQNALSGEWQKVYHCGEGDTDIHYFQHRSGKIAWPKTKFRGRD